MTPAPQSVTPAPVVPGAGNRAAWESAFNAYCQGSPFLSTSHERAAQVIANYVAAERRATIQFMEEEYEKMKAELATERTAREATRRELAHWKAVANYHRVTDLPEHLKGTKP